MDICYNTLKIGMPKFRRKRYECTTCGSSNISFEAQVKWNVNEQVFVLEWTPGNGYTICNNCGREREVVEIIEDEEV